MMTDREYFVRGMTALLDAVGKTILDVGNRLSKTSEEQRPSKVIFVITTDGMENASREFTYEKVKGRVPVVVGIGGNNTKEVMENLETYPLDQAAAALIASPYYNTP
mgnify:CR=1 FL=1